MRRICMVAYADYVLDTRIRREAESLVDRGDYVDVIGLADKGRRKPSTLNGVHQIQLPIPRYRGSNPGLYMASYLLFFLLASLWLIYLHWKNRYQVIQVHTMPDFMVFVAVIPKLLGAKVVLDVHDLMPELYRSKFKLAKTHWLIRWITWLEQCSIGFADRAIAVHLPHLEALVAHGNPAGKFTVLLNLPDPKIFGQARPAVKAQNGPFKLLYHGTVSKRHGLHIALEAISRLHGEIPGLSLYVAGEGDALPSLVNLAKELGLGDCVTFSQRLVPIEQLLPTLLEADVGIVPILNDEFTRYMLPVKLLEYVALNKLVICARTKTIETYFDDSTIQYFEAGNAADLAGKIRLLYRDPSLRARLRANTDRFNREHSWGHQKQVYYRLIDSLCEANVTAEWRPVSLK